MEKSSHSIEKAQCCFLLWLPGSYTGHLQTLPCVNPRGVSSISRFRREQEVQAGRGAPLPLCRTFPVVVRLKDARDAADSHATEPHDARVT